MAKFHINAKGEAGSCKAQAGGCPFGGAADHYDSPEEARAAYEAAQASSFADTKTKVKRTEHYTIRQTFPDSPMVARMGSWATPEEAQEALDHMEGYEGKLEVVKSVYTVKTVAVSEEEVVPAEVASTPSFGAVGSRIKVPTDVAKTDPALQGRGGQVAEIVVRSQNQATIQFSDGKLVSVPLSHLHQTMRATAVPEDKSFDGQLKRAEEELQAEYDALEDTRGWMEKKVGEAGDTTRAVDETSPGTDAYREAVAARDAARIRLLAADLVAAKKYADTDPAMASRMTKNTRTQIAADRALDSALANRGAISALARQARIQPEDVATVLEQAKRGYRHPRSFRNQSLSELAADRSWTANMARHLRCQPEDVADVLSYAARFEKDD